MKNIPGRMVACCGSVVFCAEDFLLRCRAGPQQLPPTPLSGDELSLPQPSKCPCCSCSPSETLSERVATGHSILCAHRTCLLRPKASYQDLSFSRWAAHHSLDIPQGLCRLLRPTMHGYLNPNKTYCSPSENRPCFLQQKVTMPTMEG